MEISESDLFNAFAHNKSEDLVEKNLIRELLSCGQTHCVVKNSGSWFDSSDTTRDIYQDICDAFGLIRASVAGVHPYLIMNPDEEKYLDCMDSDRTPWYKTIAPLFYKAGESPKWDFILTSEYVPHGVAIIYLCPDVNGVALINIGQHPRFNGEHLASWVISEFDKA